MAGAVFVSLLALAPTNAESAGLRHVGYGLYGSPLIFWRVLPIGGCPAGYD